MQVRQGPEVLHTLGRQADSLRNRELPLQPESFGPRRVYLDGKELQHNYDSMESWTVPVTLEAGKVYDFKFETANSSLGAFRAQVWWKTPAIHAREAVVEQREKTRSVYLPAGTQWIDFGREREAGGRQKHCRGCSHREDAAHGQGRIHCADGAARSILH